MSLELRLQKRHHQLVRSHMVASDLLSAGVKSTLSESASFSQTQAAWRFFNNERCTLSDLMTPIHTSLLEQEKQVCQGYALIVHDWSSLSYKTHTSKHDRFGIHHPHELGYELQASLLLSDQHGGPIAPIAMNVVTNTEVLSTYRDDGCNDESHLTELALRIGFIEQLGLSHPAVHIIDREGDSVGLMRVLGDCHWLVRCRCNSHVVSDGVSQRVDRLAKTLTYTIAQTICYHGQPATQALAELTVAVARDAKPKKNVVGQKQQRKGKAVKARLIVSRITNHQGQVIAWWYLLTNLTGEVARHTIATWYYWRWSIESFFKLLKSAGMQVESWQQTTGLAIARRLLVACMACVFIWQLADQSGPAAKELRTVLIKCSGRQMKWGVAFTRPALLAGLYVLLAALDLIDQYDIKHLKHLLSETIGDLLV